MRPPAATHAGGGPDAHAARPLVLPLARVLLGVLLPFALAHFVSYLYRNVNTVVYPDLVRDIGLDASGLGLLTGAYMGAFALAQLPVGMALDRYGPRRVQLPMLCVAALGGLLFARAQSFEGLLLARALIGLGVSASLMAAIKASSLWLPVHRLPLSTAVLLAVGGLGAMASTAPMQWAIDTVGWRAGFVGIAGCALAVAVLIAVRVPEHPARPSATRLRDMVRSVGHIYASGAFWCAAGSTLVANGAYMAIQGLWLGPWLRDVGHLPRGDAAQVLFWGAAGMVAGSLMWGGLTDRLQRHRVRPVTVCGLGMLAFLACQGLMLMPQTPASATLLAVALSVTGTACAMNYAIVAQTLPAQLTGRASTSFNLLIFLAAFGLQWGLGEVIALWPPGSDGSYPEAAYRAAWGVALVLQLPGCLLWLGQRPWQRAALRPTTPTDVPA